MRILIALPGLHKFNRGAELAFIAVAEELVRRGEDVTLIGSGPPRDGAAYRYLCARSVNRNHFERWPQIPVLRNEYCYEELTFLPELLLKYRPSSYDITVTCSYPFTNWALRRLTLAAKRPRHVFVTHNGDWPPYVQQSAERQSEYRYFDCDGLICINPDFFQRNANGWNCRLIPNGVDLGRFRPGAANRAAFGLPEDRMIVLMVSALIANKRIEVGVEAVSRIPNAHLAVAGDGPLRDSIASLASRLLPGRFTRLTAPPDRMPALYQSADVFMQCSKDEPFPLVFLEAMACGLPIVAHETPRVHWFLGDDEFLADMDDPAAAARAIETASSQAAAGRERRLERAAGYSWAKVAEMYADFFRELLR